jgi:YidC/Oxa1 family membrane protein insertase
MAFYFLKEVGSLFRFLIKTKKKDKEIIFYSERKDYYPYFEGIINELVDKYEQTFSYITSDPEDPILKNSEIKIKTFYLNKLLPFFMLLVNCKVFVMTLTDLNQFHLKRSINPVHYVYVFHAMNSIHMFIRFGSFDYYDSLLCVGPYTSHELREYEKLYNLPKKEIVKAGYYRLERIYNNYLKYLKDKKECLKKTILIAPSWGKDNIIESYGEKLTEILLNEEYKVIVRPHPETVKRYPKILNQLENKFKKNKDFKLERDVVSDNSLLEADVMISDCSGVVLEYTLGTERPVLILDVPIKVSNPRYKELGIEPFELKMRKEAGIILSPKEIDKVPEKISELIGKRSYYKEKLAKIREKNVYAFGKSSEIGAEHIIEVLKRKKGSN